MRELLTGLAIVLIVALTAALVGPYLVDWNGQRSFIEARLSQVLGQKVTIGGNIDVKLLPTPYLVLGQTVIGDDEAPVRLSIHHLDLELSVTPLLHGELDVTQALLVEPTIRVTLSPDRTLPALPDAPAFHADVSLDHLAVTGGTLAIADPLSGRTFVLDNLDVEADAASLAGPFKLAGTEGPEGRPTSFRLSTAAAQDGRAHVRLVVAGNADHAGLDLDGTLALSSAGRSNVRQSFSGRVAITGTLDESAGAPVAWTLSGPLEADPRRAALDGGELRLGSEDKGLTLAASGSADLGANPRIDLDLSAKTLDLDRLSDASPDPQKPPPPPRLPAFATIRRALLAATPPLPMTVDAKVDTATWAGETLAGLSAHVGVGGTGPQPFSLAGDGPGGSHLAVGGRLTPFGFAGHVAFSAKTPVRTAAWAATIDPASPIRGGDLSAAPLSASADIAVGEGRIVATKVALTLGRSKFTGTARLDPAGADLPAKLTTMLSSPALDLDTLPDLARWRRPGRALDLDLKLDATTLLVAAAGQGPLSTGPIHLAATKAGRHFALNSFSAQNLGGATITAQGTLDPQSAHLALDVDAASLDAAAKLARQVAPGEFADAFARRAPALAPAKLDLDATWAVTAKGLFAPTRAGLDGTLRSSTVHAALVPDQATPGAVALTADLSSPEGNALLAQLGAPVLPIDKLGASKITLTAHGDADQPLDTTLAVAIGPTTLDVAGKFKLLGAPRGGSGTLEIETPDISPLLRSLALAFPDMSGRLPLHATSTVAYGSAGFGLTALKATIAGTAATGTLRFAPQDAEAPGLTGALALDRLSLATLLGLALGPEQPSAPQSAWSNLAFETSLGADLAEPPPTALQLKVETLDLTQGLAATNAVVDLTIAPGLVTLKHLAATMDGGHVGGDLSLRRDGPQAGLEGTLEASGVAVDLPAFTADLSGKLQVAGSGTSSLALVSSLAGAGEATFADLSVKQADPSVLSKLFADVERDALSVDATTVSRAFADAAVAPLDAGTRRFDLSLAGGTLAFAPQPSPAPEAALVTTEVDGMLDVRRPSLAIRAKETLRALPDGWSGAAPALVVAWNGPPSTQQRTIDVGPFINAVAARALTRETARIEAYEQDIRERSFFNARLLSERRRMQDKTKAEAAAREAEAARIATARREAATKSAEKAARDRAAQDRAAQDRAAQDRANEDRETKDRTTQGEAPPRPTPPTADQGGVPPRFAPAPPGASADPSAAGRY